MIIYGDKLADTEYVVRPGVYGLAFDGEFKVALVKVPYGYHLPGGGIEEDEDHEMCLRRELLEETGYSIDITKMLNISHQYAYSERSHNYYELVGHFYVVTFIDKKSDPVELDHELEWHPINDAMMLLSLEYQREALIIAFNWIVSEKNRILDVLRKNYKIHPDQLSTAFWKYSSWIGNEQAFIEVPILGIVDVKLERNLLYTNRRDDLLMEALNTSVFDLIVTTQDVGELKQWKHDHFFKIYKPLKQTASEYGHVPQTKCLDGYVVNPVVESEYTEVVDFINRSYRDIRVTLEEVKGWTTLATYDPSLWIWVIDLNTDKKVALGIAERDLVDREGVLEWIQVDENDRGKGLGSFVVNHLLANMMPNVDFVTVSGDTHNESVPEKLYRSCGFEGNVIWHIYRRTTRA